MPIEALAEFRRHFYEVVKHCEQFAILCRLSSLQKEAIAKLQECLIQTLAFKEQAITEGNECVANEMLARDFTLSAMINELQTYIALKEDRARDAWAHLVNAQMAAASATRVHSVAVHLETIFIPRLHELESLLFPPQLFVSLGSIIEQSECSICHAVYGDCEHLRGRAYMGRLCSRIIKKATPLEVSLVTNPASKHHCVHSFTDDDGVPRDPLSLGVVPPEGTN